MHKEEHPLAGKTVKIKEGTIDPIQGLVIPGAEYRIEDWQDRVYGGKSWMFAEGNPAAIQFAIRVGINNLPIDNEVVYGKIGALGHIVHVSELGDEVE